MRNSKPLSPTTTLEEDLVTAGQRNINRVWEYTQAIVAILVTGAFLYCEIIKVDSDAVKMAFSLVIGFYFSRTNHTATGGEGKKKSQTYVGR